MKIPTQNLLRLILLLKFVMRIVGNNLLQIWKRGLVIKLNFFSDFEHFGQDFEVELNLGQYSEVRFGRDLEV